MSRSKRKTPKTGLTTAESEKKDKVFAHRKFRRASKVKIKSNKEPLIHLNEISDIWNFAKDTKKYYDKEDLERYPKAIRK